MLVKVTPPVGGPPPVAVKVFGDKTELIIDRDAEKHVLVELNRAGFGAQVRGRRQLRPARPPPPCPRP